MRIRSFLNADYISLFFMTTFTLLTIVNKDISVFYIIYLFWFHEFLRTFIRIIFYVFKKDKITNRHVYFSTLKSKLFFLLIYVIFIFIFFGILLDSGNQDLILINFEVFMLKNDLFNLTITTFLIRELIFYFNNDIKKIYGNMLLSNGVIILHISIILGTMIWFFLPKNWYENTNSNILSGFVIAPFLLLKLFFEMKETKQK